MCDFYRIPCKAKLKKKLSDIDQTKYRARYLRVVARIEAGDGNDHLKRWLPGAISVKEFRKKYPSPRRKDNCPTHTLGKTVSTAVKLKRMRYVKRQGRKPADVAYRTKHFRTDVVPTKGTCVVKPREVIDSKSAASH